MKTSDTETCINHAEFHRLNFIKNAARLALGFIWVWEGLVPRMLWPSQTQFDMVVRSG